jgi:hypothetical protein
MGMFSREESCPGESIGRHEKEVGEALALDIVKYGAGFLMVTEKGYARIDPKDLLKSAQEFANLIEGSC